MSASSAERADRMVLLFSLGGRRWATRAGEVRRVARRGGDVRFWDDSPLGAAPRALRGLVSALPTGEEALAVDEVEGVIAGAHVLDMPLLARDCMPDGAIAGFVDDGNELLPLVDLPALLRRRIEREDFDGAERGASEDDVAARNPQAG
jgi:hypothetical protein